MYHWGCLEVPAAEVLGGLSVSLIFFILAINCIYLRGGSVPLSGMPPADLPGVRVAPPAGSVAPAAAARLTRAQDPMG